MTSASSFTAKFGMGIGGAITGMLLSIGHYTPNKTQSAAALFSIEANYVWVPLVALVISFILILFYRLTPEKEVEMTHYINAKHAREDSEDNVAAMDSVER